MSDWLQRIMSGDESVEIPEDIGEISKLSNALVEAQREVRAAEEELKNKKENLKRIQEEALPEAFSNIGLKELKLDSGAIVKIKEFVACSIKKETQDEAWAWLRAEGHGDIIKNNVVVNFGKETDHLTSVFLDVVREWIATRNEAKAIGCETKTSVHYQTLAKFTREMLEKGEILPDRLFSVYHGQKAEIKGE